MGLAQAHPNNTIVNFMPKPLLYTVIFWSKTFHRIVLLNIGNLLFFSPGIKVAQEFTDSFFNVGARLTFLWYSALRKNTATHELLEGGDCSHKIHQLLQTTYTQLGYILQ